MRRAEAALAADPAAAETLHSLAAVRDLVAGLSRPPAPDVSTAVLRRLATDVARPHPWKAWGPYVVRGLGASGLAASVALIVLLGGLSRSRSPVEQPSGSRTAAPQVASSRLAPVSVPVATNAAPSPLREVAESPQLVPVSPAPTATAAPAVAVVESRTTRRDDPPGFRELWATAGPRRDFVVTPGADESTTKTVATLLGQSTHRDFYKIVIPHGANVVPDAEASVAFAATLDPNEFATLRRRLETHFGNRVEANDADPEVSALLAEFGQATSSPATPAADVLIPQNELALRVHSDAPSSLQPKLPTDRSGSAAPHDDAPPPSTTADPTRTSVVLIWIVGSAPD